MAHTTPRGEAHPPGQARSDVLPSTQHHPVCTSRPVRLWPPLVLCLGLLLPTSAQADPKDDARRHFVAGLAAAQSQQYELALSEFLEAQAAYPHPFTLYNIARAYTDLGDLTNAIGYYELCRDAAPHMANDIDPVLAVLRARHDRQSEPAAETVAGATATSSQVQRLQAIAEELAELSEALVENTAATLPAAGQGTTGTTDPDAELPALPESGAFLSEAYERVVITASRYGQSQIDSPVSTTILTAEDIRLSGATNLPDLMRRVVVVEVMSLAASQPDVSIRGFNRELSNKVLVLVDGRSVYLDPNGTVYWSSIPISLQEIERIEIIRGPGSAVYGANAMTGVINIITAPPGTSTSQVHVEGGQPGYGQLSIVASNREGELGYRFSAGYHQTGRWSADALPSDHSALTSAATDHNLAQQVVRANGRLDWSVLDDGYASISGGYAQGESEFYIFGALGDTTLDFTRGYLRGDLAYGPVHLRAFTNTFDTYSGPWLEYEGARSLVTDLSSNIADVEAESNHSFTTGPIEHTLNAGVGYRYKTTSWTFIHENGKPIDEHHTSAFAQERADLDRLSLVGSLRVDNHPLVDIRNTLSPRGAAIFRIAERTSIRASGGTSFRAPTHMESYVDFNQPTDADAIFIGTLGNEDLLPEWIQSGELGLHDESSPYHRADVAVFVNKVTDLIYVQDINPEVSDFDSDEAGFQAGYIQFANLDPVYTGYGLEADLQLFPVDGLDLYANVDLQRIMEEDGNERVQDGSTSALKVNVGAMLRTPWRLDIAGHLHYVSPQTWRLREYNSSGQLVTEEAEVPARFIGVTHLTARPFENENLEIGATAWNIGAFINDERFREHPKGQLVGPRTHASIRYEF